MKKDKLFICGGIGVLILAVILGVFLLATNGSSGIKLETNEDFSGLIDKIYDKTKLELMALETHDIDIKDELALNSYTGLSSNKKVKKLVVSESMTSSIAYSLVLVQVKNKADVEKVKKEMVDNINLRKWICVGADVVYATSYKDVIFLVMGNEETASSQYNVFKSIVDNKIGKELSREAEVIEF